MKTTSEQLKECDDMEVLGCRELKKRFPFLTIKENHGGLFSLKKSAYINPRKLIKAQKQLALEEGCDVINDVVKKITTIGSGK